MDKLHPLIRRQWQRYFGRDRAVADEWRPFLRAVSDAYGEFDTARRMVERALELSSAELHAANAELRGVLQVLPDLLFRMGADGKIRGIMQGSAVNDHPALHALGESAATVSTPGARTFWAAIERAREGAESFVFEYAQDTAAGNACYEVRLLPLVERDMIGIVRDITERKRAENALHESKERLALAQRAGRVGTFDWEVGSGKVFWSTESEEIFGISNGQFDGTYGAWRERVVPEDLARLETFFQTWLASDREDEQWEYRIIRPDRQERCIEGRGRALRDANGKAVRVIGTHVDVTARNQAEQDRLVLGKLESTGILAGGIAHDFNNLLTGILLSVDMAKISADAPKLWVEYLATARLNVVAAQLLTQQLLTFARGGTAPRESVQLATLLREWVSLPLSGSNVRSEILILPELLLVEADVGQIAQVVRNLVLNAREAMPDGGVVAVRAENALLPAGNALGLRPGYYVRVQIKDQGPGIPSEVLPKIFDPYFSTKTRGTQKGMGLGLTICHSIVQKHGGAIAVDSSPGSGARFSIYLPAIARSAQSLVSAEKRTDSASRAKKILVMDDEAMVRESCQLVLRHLGHEVVLAEEGEAAADFYFRAKEAGKPFDVVFLDLTVKGGMGGKEAADLLRARDPSVRMVVMSGYSGDDIMRQYQQHGFKGALAKPFDCSALENALRQALTT